VRHQRAREHAVEALDPHLLVEPDLGQMGQAIGIVGVGLVGRQSSAAVAWRASMQIAGGPSALSA
jgi:hypothetical protein